MGSERYELEDFDAVNSKIQEEGATRVVKYCVNDKFEFDLDSIERVLRDNRIKAFVLTASSNATGYCPDIKKIGELVHRYGAYYIVDACQYLQHHKLDMQELGIDFLAASGHKFYAPYGGGFLIGPKVFFDCCLPYEIGGSNLPYIDVDGRFYREKSPLAHDPGTPNALGAISMAAALKEIDRIGIEHVKAYETALAKQLYDALSNHHSVELFVSPEHLSTILPFNVKGIDAKEVARMLNDDYGVGVRYGSFCVYDVVRRLLDIRDDSHIVSEVLSGQKDAVPGFVRASVSLCNSQEDIDRFIHALEDICRRNQQPAKSLALA